MAKHRANPTRIGEAVDRFLAGREPALIATVAGVGIKLLGAFWLHLSVDQQSVLNAVVVAGLGLAVAFATRDGFSAAILGFVQALIALAIGFGLNLTADNQALIMSFVATAIGMFTRTQVTAPVPPPPAR